MLAAIAAVTGFAVLPAGDSPTETAASVAEVEPSPVVVEPPPPPSELPDVGSAIELVDHHFGGVGDVRPALWDARALARLVPEAGDRTIRIEADGDVTDVDLGQIVKTKDRVVLGPGRFRFVQPIPWHRERPFEIRGAGAPRTEIFSPNHDFFGVRKGMRMEGLIVRELTFDGSGPTSRRGGGLLGVRGTAVVLIERVRFQRWPDKAGYGAPVGVGGPDGRALVIYRNCDFVGGYWRRPGGNAICVRGGALALLDRCRLFDMSMAVSAGMPEDVSRRSAVHMTRCRFVNTKVTDSRLERGGSPMFPVRVRDSHVFLGRANLQEDVRLARWGRALLAEAERIELSPAAIRCRVSDFVRALRFVRVPRGFRISAVQSLAWEDETQWHCGVLLVGDGWEMKTKIVRRDRGGYSMVDPALFPHLGFASPELPYLGPDLREVLPHVERSFGHDTPVRSLAITPGPRGQNVLLMHEDDRVMVVSLETLRRRATPETEPK
jgi:hypothetical protein